MTHRYRTARPTVQMPGSRTDRARRPLFDSLEARWVLSGPPSILFANAVGVIGNGSVDLESNAVTNDAAGQVYVTGSLQGTADFDPSAATSNLESAGGRDVFIAKYAKNGSIAWSKGLKGADAQSVAQGSAIAVDGAGNVIVGGTFTGTVDFDPGPAVSNLSAPSRNDGFLAKFDKDGNFLWARAIAATPGNLNQTYAIAVDSAGNVAAAGSFQGASTFGATTLTAEGSFEGFVTKLDASGQFLWARGTVGSGPSVAQGTSLAFDPSGNIVDAGFFAGTVDFDPGPGARSLISAGSRDVYVRKLDGLGNLVWGVAVGAEDIDQANSVTVDGSGSVYVTGMFSNAVDFDPGAGTAVLNSGGFFNPFLLKLNGSGQYSWAKAMPIEGFSAGQGTGVGVTSSGRAFVAGYFQGVMTVGPGVALTSAGGFDVFVAAYEPDGALATSARYGGSNFDAEFGVGVNASGQVALAGRYTGPATFDTVTLPSWPNKSIYIAQLDAGVAVAPPPRPGGLALQAASDTGLSSSDRITRASALSFDVTGISAPTNLLQLLRNGVVVASRIGPGVLTDPGPVPNGVHAYTARQTDAQGQAGPATPSLAVTVDAVAPVTPPAPTLLGAEDTGVLGDNRTSVRQPWASGSAEGSARVELLNASGVVIATGTATAGGGYSLSLSATPLPDGTHTFRARVTDAAGNVSATGPALTIVVDGTPPATPPAPVLLPADDTGTVGDGVTTVRRPRITGTAEANATVQLLDASNNLIGTAVATAGGAYTISLSSDLAYGSFSFRARGIDAAGNVGALGAAFSLTVVAPSVTLNAPSTPILSPADDSGALGDDRTNVRQPRLQGSATPGLTIEVLNASNVIVGTAVAAGSGSFVVTIASSLPDGAHSFRARARDASGNLSGVTSTLILTIDGTAPGAPSTPSLLGADDTGVLGDGVTSLTRPRIVGTAEPGARVEVLGPTLAVLATTTAGPSGAFTATLTTAIPLGTTLALRARAIDAAGNVGPSGEAFTLTVRADAPPTPSVPTLAVSDDSGVVGDGKTVVRRPGLAGSAQPGATVELVDAFGVVVGLTTAGSDGSFVVRPSANLSLGAAAFQVRARDSAGTVGQSSLPTTVHIISLPLGDFDGDGMSDQGIFRPSTSQWISRDSSGSGTQIRSYGGPNLMDVPVVGDYDGDGKSDTAVFRVATAQWFIRGANGQTSTVFGANGLFDIPAPGDYDGDGKTDIAVFRPSTAQWFVMTPTGGKLMATFGATNLFDIPVPGDYDGDGKTDIAIFRPSTAQWFVMTPTGGMLLDTFGGTNFFDIPAPGDYDGDGKTEVAVFRPGTAQWFARSGTGTRVLGAFGGSNYLDLPSQTSVGSLQRLGVVVPTWTAARSIQSAPVTAALIAIPPGAEPLSADTGVNWRGLDGGSANAAGQRRS